MGRVEVALVVVSNSQSNFSDLAGGAPGETVAPVHPHDVIEILVAIAQVPAIVSTFGRTVGLKPLNPAIHATPEIGRGEDYQDPLFSSFLNDPVDVGKVLLVGAGEITRRLERSFTIPVSHVTKIHIPTIWVRFRVENIYYDGVEALLAPVLEILLSFLFRQVLEKRPRSVAMVEKGNVVLIYEVSLVYADLEWISRIGSLSAEANYKP
jgi:hypothetical protein